MYQLMEDNLKKNENVIARKITYVNSKEVAVRIWNDCIRDMDRIAKLTKLPIDEVKKLFDNKTA